MTAVVSHAPVLGPLDSAPMRRKQVLILLLALLLAAMDGYDALAMAFAAPSVSQAWHVSKGALGLLLASGLFGMGLGAILVSPLADVWGRKRVALCALSLMTVGSLVCGFAGSVPMLAVGRIITGAGIGVMVAMTTLISAEFSSIKHRSLVIAGVATVGFPIGGVIGGVGAAFMIRTVGWEWIFLAGAIAGAALFVLVLLLLPESPAFLISRRAPDALDKLNHVLGRLGHPAIAALPAASERQRVSYKELLAPGLGVLTLRLLAINLLIAMAAYYMLNWLPQLIADAGFSAQTASLVSSLSGLVGIFGGVVLGALAARFPAPRLAGIAMIFLAIALCAIGLAPPVLAVFAVAAGAFSFFLSATTGMTYGVIADSFPPLVRATGVGVVMGISRFASALGPALGGWMFAAGLTRAEVSVGFAALPVLAALLMIRLPNRRSGVLVGREPAAPGLTPAP